MINNNNSELSEDLLGEFISQNTEAPEKEEPTEDIEPLEIPKEPVKEQDLVNEFASQFEEEGVEEESEDSPEPNLEEPDSDYSFKALATYLSDEGIIDFEDSEDLEDSPELLFQSVQKTIEAEIKNYKESIPEVGKKFLEYLEKGGDPSKFIEAAAQPIDFKSLDLEDTNIQKQVVSEYLKTQDYTQEEIDDLLQDYEDSLILEKQATLAAKKLEKIHSKKLDQLTADQEAAVEAQKEQAAKYVNTLTTTIDSSEQLGGLEVTKKDKDAFKAYLLQTDKNGLTQYQKDINEDPVKTQLELAYLKFKKFDFGKVAKTAKSDAARAIFKGIKATESNPKGKAKEVDLEDDNSLSVFKGAFGRQNA